MLLRYSGPVTSLCAPPGRKEQRYWDGQKAVYVVLLGSTVVLPCINRRNVWTDWSNEEEDQQVGLTRSYMPGVASVLMRPTEAFMRRVRKVLGLVSQKMYFKPKQHFFLPLK